ncbi:MAG: hypothetical protein KC589_02980 [Nanoarchaeota archaeon]|nr:hypothetical protein [Nanoarchaeota archaeon]MCA9495881.1 hypothetical protein [Nanoarchaeota archaeon]
MFFKNKKAITAKIIVGLIIALFSLIILAFILTPMIKNANYDSSIAECRFFLQNVKGKPIFFNNSLDSPNNLLLEIMAETCHAKDVKISENNILPATTLVEDCWAKSGKGIDFLGANVEEGGICIYCGSIYSKDEISNFDELFQKEIKKSKYDYLFESSEIINLNKAFLKENSINPDFSSNDNSISVFYYIYKPKQSQDGTFDIGYYSNIISTKISKIVGNWDGAFSLINYEASSSNINSVGGIILTSNVKISSEDETYKDDINKVAESCSFVIPKKIYS